MTYRRHLNNNQIVPLALRGGDGETKSGSMSTEHIVSTYHAHRTGWMPKPWARLYADRVREAKADQVIYSYATPIAWLDRDYGWVIPDLFYSMITSSRHMPHLYDLGGTRHAMPSDATPEDARRVLSGELVFTTKGYGSKRVFTGTVPGPNYISGIVAVGERIRFLDSEGIVRVGVIVAKGSIAGFADVGGVEMRFDDYAILKGR